MKIFSCVLRCFLWLKIFYLSFRLTDECLNAHGKDAEWYTQRSIRSKPMFVMHISGKWSHFFVLIFPRKYDKFSKRSVSVDNYYDDRPYTTWNINIIELIYDPLFVTYISGGCYNIFPSHAGVPISFSAIHANGCRREKGDGGVMCGPVLQSDCVFDLLMKFCYWVSVSNFKMGCGKLLSAEEIPQF